MEGIDNPQSEGNMDSNNESVKGERDSKSRKYLQVMNQAEEIKLKNGGLWETYFYKTALAGNESLIENILNYGIQNGKKDTADWLLQRGVYERNERLVRKPKRQRLLEVGMWLLFTIVSTALTPVFYGLHIISTSLSNQQDQRITRQIKLPIVFAVFSQNEALVKYFLSIGVRIEYEDEQGNNIFHYVADLSAYAPERAVEIFKSTVRLIDEKSMLRMLLIESRNSFGLTAVEYVAKYGSMILLTDILNHTCLLNTTEFAVNDQDVYFNEDIKCSEEIAETRLDLIDVTLYEASSITHQSTLLNLLSDRDIVSMSETDLKLFERKEFVGKWILLKSKQMLAGIFVFQLMDLIVTALLLYTLLGGNYVSEFWEWKTEANLKVMVKEIKAMGNNESYIFKQSEFQRIYGEYQRVEQIFQFNRLLSSDQRETVYNEARSKFPNITYEGSFNLTRDTPRQVVEGLYEQALLMPKLKEKWDSLLVFRFLEIVMQKYAEHLDKSTVDVEEIKAALHLAVNYDMDMLLQNLTFTHMNFTVRPSLELSYYSLKKAVCIPKRYFTDDDFETTVDMPPPSDLYFEACECRSLLNKAENTCNKISNKEFYAEYGYEYEILKGLYDIIDCFIAIGVFSGLYILIDIIERGVFMYTCVVHHDRAWDMFLTVLGQKVPGSYARKQINVITYSGILGYLILEAMYFYKPERVYLSTYEVLEIGRYVLVLALVFRCIMHIHTMRLFPGIGYFVITTFMMSTNLIHFSSIFGMVLVVFAVIFHVLIDEPECPVVKYDGFATFQDSLFSTFVLAFGQGDFDAYFTSPNVKLTYVLFVIIVALLLLNLIIAIMSSTAETIMAQPWKETLWWVEWLDEATSVEYTFCIFGLLCRRFCGHSYASHKRAGFNVKEKDGENRIYIEVFHCPALEADG